MPVVRQPGSLYSASLTPEEAARLDEIDAERAKLAAEKLKIRARATQRNFKARQVAKKASGATEMTS